MTIMRTNPAARLGFEPGQAVVEIGRDGDIDQQLRASVEELIGQELAGEDFDDVPDAFLLWFRAEDGDLTDALADATGRLTENGMICLLAPATGRPGYIGPGVVNEAAQTSGLTSLSALGINPTWTAFRLVSPKGVKG